MTKYRVTVKDNEVGASDWKEETIVLEFADRRSAWDAMISIDKGVIPGRYIKFIFESIEECKSNEENNHVAGDGDDCQTI